MSVTCFDNSIWEQNKNQRNKQNKWIIIIRLEWEKKMSSDIDMKYDIIITFYGMF